MICVRPLTLKVSSEVKQSIKELVLYIERKFKQEVDRVYIDKGTEPCTKKFKEWCADHHIRRTTTVPEDSNANGSVDCAVGIIERQARTVLSEAKLKGSYW